LSTITWWRRIGRMKRRRRMRTIMMRRIMVVDRWAQECLEGCSGLSSTTFQVECGLPPCPPDPDKLGHAPVEEAVVVHQ
jgi:hypothetical protein